MSLSVYCVVFGRSGEYNSENIPYAFLSREAAEQAIADFNAKQPSPDTSYRVVRFVRTQPANTVLVKGVKHLVNDIMVALEPEARK